MNSSISKKDLIKTAFLSILIIFSITIYQLKDRRTKIVFCDVGQGDAIYIRIKNRIDVLIDAGIDKKVLSCLGKYMPFWDKKIEMAFLTHHDKDHYGGFFNVIERYKINNFFTINYQFDTKTYKKLEEKIKNKKINYQYVYKNDEILILNNKFRFLWPIVNLKSYDSNDYSLVFLFQENNYKVLFTGDASPKALNSIYLENRHSFFQPINILKIPHHGSKNGLTEKFLQLAHPEIAVISVGKNNPNGHPHKEILDLLKAYKIKIRRTDDEGDIVFKISNIKN